MKKDNKRNCMILVTIATFVVISGLNTLEGIAAEKFLDENNIIYEDNVLRADDIVIKYRTYNGVKQYRRWNKTKEEWVDPDWIDLY